MLDSVYKRTYDAFKASEAGKVLEPTNLGTMQLHALSKATVENVTPDTTISINLPNQYAGIKIDLHVQFWGNFTTPVEQVDANDIKVTLKAGEFLYILDPRVDMTKGKVYIAA